MQFIIYLILFHKMIRKKVQTLTAYRIILLQLEQIISKDQFLYKQQLYKFWGKLKK